MMDLNHLLVWIVCTSCAALTLNTIRHSSKHTQGWLCVSASILAITLLMSYLHPTKAGIVGGTLWGVFMLAPSLGLKKVNQLVAQQRYTQARRLATIMCWLHPLDGWCEQPKILRALELAQLGEMTGAVAILNRYKTHKTLIGLTATATLYQMDSNWPSLLFWVQNILPQSALHKDSTLLIYYLRALGETGDLNSLLQTIEQYESLLEKISDPVNRNLGRLFAFAFCGDKESVIKLLNGPLAVYPRHTHQFWLATVEMAAGNRAFAYEQMANISHHPDVSIRNAARRRLSQPLVDPQTELTQNSRKILSHLATELDQETRYGAKGDFWQKSAIATICLIVLNLLTFALEVMWGGSTNLDTLYRMGALIPEEVLAGAWWRLVAATFLHYGFVHLLMNMLALYVLGPFVEFALGAPQYLLAYFMTGAGSMLVAAVMAVMGYSKADFVVGASGCVMGIIGVTAAILLRGWKREKSRLASKRLRLVLLIIGFQIIFDLTTPQISFISHASGLSIGFLFGCFLRPSWQTKN